MNVNHQIVGKYGLEATGIEPFLKGHTNTQFIIKTQHGKFFLRRYSKPQESGWNRIVRTEETILFEHDVLRYASDHGIPCIPPIKNNEGNTLTKVGDRFYALFPFVEADEYAPPTSEKGIRAAKLLAEYHEVMKNYPITRQRPNWGYAGKLAEWFHHNELDIGNVDEILDWIHTLKPDNETFDYLRQEAGNITDMVKMLREECPEDAYKKYPILVNHGDYIANNIGVKGKGLVLFDFDFCVRDLRIYDLSILITYTAGEEHTGKNVDPQVARNIVQSYREMADMSAEELSLAPYMAIAYRLHIFLGNLGILKSTLNTGRLTLLQRNVDSICGMMERRQEMRDFLKSI